MVGAGSVPCTLNFKFENNFSWITEVSYKIRVIQPSAEILLSGRRSRAASGLKALDNDIVQTNKRLNEAYSQRNVLKNEIESVLQQIQITQMNLQQIREEEMKTMIAEYKTFENHPVSASRNRFEF